MRSSRLTRFGGVALVAALALTVAACGGDDDDSDAPAATDPGPDATEPVEAPPTDPADEPGDPADSAAPATEPMTEPTSEPTSPPEVADPVSIRFTWWGNPDRDALTAEQIALFEEQNPLIDVVAEPTVFDGYFDLLSTQFAAGDAPDVVTLGGSWPTEYGGNGVLLDLNEVADVVQLDQYDPNTYAAAELDGAVYGLPTGGNTVGLLVNTDLVAQAGLELPDDASWDWPDFVAWVGDLSAALGDDVYGTDWRIQEVKGPFAAQRGEPLYLREGGIGVTAPTIEALYQLSLDLLDNGGMPPAEVTVEMNNTSMEQTLFGQAKAATMFGYSNQLQSFADLLGADVTILKIPGESNYAEPGLTVLPSQFFAVTSGSDHPEEAAALVDFLLNDPGSQEIILANRGVSFNAEILEHITPLMPEYDQIGADYLARIAEEGGPNQPPPESGQQEVDDTTLRLHDEVLFGSLSPADAAAEWIANAESVIP